MADPVAISELITATLNQLLLASGVAGGATGSGLLFYAAKYFAALHQGQSAGNFHTAMDKAVSEALGSLFDNGKKTLAGIKGKDIRLATAEGLKTLESYGIKVDSSVFEAKLRSRLGEILLHSIQSKIAATPAQPAPTTAPATQ